MMGNPSTSEEFSWRSFASMVWVVMMLPFVLGLFVLAVNVSLWSPITWISGSLSQIFSLSTFGVCMLLQAVSILLTFAHKISVNVYNLPSGDGMKFYLFILRPNQLLSVIYFTACSLLFMLLLSTFTDQQQSDSLIFCGLCGLFMGISYGVEFFHKKNYKLQFPVIQQKKLFRLKKVLLPSMKTSFYFTFKTMKMFLPIFFICGFLPQGILSLLLHLNLDTSSDTSLWVSVSRYFDVSLFWSCFLMCWTTNFVLVASNKILHVYNTQALRFPIEATFVEEQGKTLSDGMASINPIEKYLAFLDYSIISRFEGVRRTKMFDLTIPGNQPHTWNKTSAQCLQLLNKQRLQLINECEKKEVTKRMYHAQKAQPKTIGQQELFSPDLLGMKTVPIASRTSQSSPIVPNFTQSTTIAQQPRVFVPLFQDLQIVIWAIEGLCNLIAFSLYEDHYGVVQKNLPEIIAQLLELLEACELFGKVSVLQNPLESLREINKIQQETADAMSLKIAVKNGVHTITSSFKYHVTSLRLSGEHKKKLHAFLEYDE